MQTAVGPQSFLLAYLPKGAWTYRAHSRIVEAPKTHGAGRVRNRWLITPPGERALKWVAVLLLAVPAVVFFVVLNLPVHLVPLTGFDSLCAECSRKATRTLPGAADSLRTKGVYVYDRAKYPKAAPVWCDLHGPDPSSENAGRAFAASLVTFAVLVGGYEFMARRRRNDGESGAEHPEGLIHTEPAGYDL
jgi:hypothetical protein